jgi:hypothetical protein
VPAQAIEQQGTRITYAALLYSMSQALEALSASQGRTPPFKLPHEAKNLFGGLLDRLVSLGSVSCMDGLPSRGLHASQ